MDRSTTVSPDFERGYEMGYINGGSDDDRPWWVLNSEESRGYQVGFRDGWNAAFNRKRRHE